MEKIIKLNIKTPILKTFQNQELLITPYISNELKAIIIPLYIQNLYTNDNNIALNMVVSENTIAIQIIRKVVQFSDGSNIDLGFLDGEGEEIDNLNAKIVSDIFDSGFWDFVKSNLSNYDEFREELEYAIAFTQKEKYSYKTLFKYIVELINKELSLEKIQKLKEEFDSQKNQLGEIFPTIKSDEEIKKEEISIEEKPKRKRNSRKALLDS